ncbi:MAG: hypothetical protein K2X29_14945, partial [Candidatus Obscuribacterales bacterium]|nr:hypothetical protein [Candidatus Obscuribacterales bacterium]
MDRISGEIQGQINHAKPMNRPVLFPEIPTSGRSYLPRFNYNPSSSGLQNSAEANAASMQIQQELNRATGKIPLILIPGIPKQSTDVRIPEIPIPGSEEGDFASRQIQRQLRTTKPTESVNVSPNIDAEVSRAK